MAKKKVKNILVLVAKEKCTEIHCDNCKGIHVLDYPIELSVLNKKLKEIKKLHENCPKKE